MATPTAESLLRQALRAPLDAALRRLEVRAASGDALDVRRFHVAERMSSLFEITVEALSDNPDIDLEAVVGQPMRFSLRVGLGPIEERVWTGLCSDLQQVAVEEQGLSRYRLTLVPALWLATQRRNYRMFQHQSEIDIARKLLGEWGISTTERLTGTYRKRKYRVQYGESDYTFLCRMLEDAGVSFCFEAEDGETRLVLTDAPQSGAARPPIAFRGEPTDADREHVTEVTIGRRVRPGKYTVRDHDYRRPPSFNLAASAAAAQGVEEKLERFHYAPGAFLFESDKGEATPSADDKGRYRTDEGEAKQLAQRRLEAKRAIAKRVTFKTNTVDLAPGAIFSMLDHPRSDLAPGKPLLVIRSELSGTHDGEWTLVHEAVSAEQPYRPALATPKPKAAGVESATVVGPPGEEIHVDEFGRVRVHFHWDRESRMDDSSSCWIHVSQPWGGAGFGGTNLPRIGQEVIVDFLGGDPDRPIIVGRVYTNLQKTPYKLPDLKTQSGWKSNSTGGTGGYNEMMFEDAQGQELVRMQAEKDLNKLVKNDEEVRIGHDRAKEVGNDDYHKVGHDRTRHVGNDEMVSIGNDRTRVVGNDEGISIGNNRTKTVGGNESLFVGIDQSENIGNNRSVDVGASHKEKIGADKIISIAANKSEDVGGSVSERIDGAKSETVAQNSTETVGGARALSIGDAYGITVGSSMVVEVAGLSEETIAQSKKLAVGTRVTVTCGATTLMMDQSGEIVISGANVTIQATGDVGVRATGSVLVESASHVSVRGSQVTMN